MYFRVFVCVSHVVFVVVVLVIGSSNVNHLLTVDLMTVGWYKRQGNAGRAVKRPVE